MDTDKIRELIRLMADNDLTELEIQDGETRISLKRGPGGTVQQVVVPAVSTISQSPLETPEKAEPEVAGQGNFIEIPSPMVGTFYAAPEPDSPPFVTVGDHVEPTTSVCIIEAMKVFNEIKSEVAGTIVKLLVANGDAVEYGQPLFLVEPDPPADGGDEHTN